MKQLIFNINSGKSNLKNLKRHRMLQIGLMLTNISKNSVLDVALILDLPQNKMSLLRYVLLLL